MKYQKLLFSNYYKATKLFCEMNELSLGWKRIRRGIPRGRRAVNDRAPTIEEIQNQSSLNVRIETRIKAKIAYFLLIYYIEGSIYWLP